MFLVNNHVKYKKARVFDPIHCKVTTQRNGHFTVYYLLVQIITRCALFYSVSILTASCSM